MFSGERSAEQLGLQYKSNSLKPLTELRNFRDRYLSKLIERNRIDEEEFDRVYSDDKIAADKASVKDMQNKFHDASSAERSVEVTENQEKLAILSKFFEVMCADHSVLSRAFNLDKNDVSAQLASEYDDIFHAVDIFLEFSKYKSPGKLPKDYALGIDVTVSQNQYQEKLNKKFRYLNNNLPSADYFVESAKNHSPEMGELSKGSYEIPHFTVNIPPSAIVEFIPLWEKWSDLKNNNRLPDEDSKKMYLRHLGIIDNPIWYNIVIQLLDQAKLMSEEFKQSRPELSELYESIHKILKNTEKTILFGYAQRDPNYAEKLARLESRTNPEQREKESDYILETKANELLSGHTKFALESFQTEIKKQA